MMDVVRNPEDQFCRVVAQFMLQLYMYFILSSPVRKYRKSYCSHPGVSVSVGVAQMLKFLVKVFMSLIS